LSATAAEPVAAAPSGKQWRATSVIDRLIPIAATLAALATGLLRPTNTDVSWLLTVNDRILAGEIPYKNVIEVNPPASILLYRIPALAAHWLPIRAEIAVVLFAALLIGATLALGRRILSSCEIGGSDRASFLLVAAFALAILPFDEMAQREHFATIFALPYALIGMARVAGKRVAPSDALCPGVLMGLSVAIKPHFALCVVFVSGFAAWRTREIRAFVRVENLAAFAIALAYVTASLHYFPDFYSDVLPMARDLYLPIRLGPAELIAHIAPALVLPILLCWAFRDPSDSAAPALLMIAAGFLAAYFLQGKGWPYHAYPAIVFALLAATWSLTRAKGENARLSLKLGALLLAAAFVVPAPSFFRRDEQHTALANAIARIQPRPKLLALSFRQSLGHPLARNLGGEWVGHSWGLWATGLAMLAKERAGDNAASRARAEAYFEQDRLATAEDIETRRPDIVLIEQTPGFDFDQWIAASPRLAAALARYKLAEMIDGVKILRREGDAANAG
jgi:hypothetical protein